MPKVRKIEWGSLSGTRPRKAGSNARLGEHGIGVRVPLARITLDDDTTGFGSCRAPVEAAQALIGQPLEALFDPRWGTAAGTMGFDFPLWDLMAKRANLPVYALAAQMSGKSVTTPFEVPCYDTSLYIDDLHLADDAAAAALIVEEAREGWARGHRAFKLKIGRGARHMPLEAGTQRDIAVIRAVRAAVGDEIPLLLDANNGYNLNLTKRVLAETADCGIYWMEEAFHEDRVLYDDLKTWLNRERLPVLIADGEGQASPALLEWAEAGLINVVQYDIFSYSFTPWLALGQKLDRWGVRSAPHHYGGHYGNYAAPHLAGAIGGFTYVEWDEATTPGLDASGYAVYEGKVCVPSAPGFGLGLEEAVFQGAVMNGGYVVE
ncbi:MAG: mandelate racemase [Caldilineaceae bacterium]|nr:mandelate racemase [Caldilineaceae bacterium]